MGWVGGNVIPIFFFLKHTERNVHKVGPHWRSLPCPTVLLLVKMSTPLQPHSVSPSSSVLPGCTENPAKTFAPVSAQSVQLVHGARSVQIDPSEDL